MYNPNPPPYAPNCPPGPGFQGGFAPIVQSPVVTTVTQVLTPPTDGPGMMLCTCCQRTVTTRPSFEIGLMAWAVCGGLFLLGCFPCMCIPFCLDSCKDVRHYCPLCNRLLHTYKRM
ncbi:lipopolysaccharide-induced tumor necrosis factor-alpha factor homolog [Oryzias melastigma]|uniref:lipopolysaccharide-induced tumor necrosis factor-alpha factor homolog n=1 Tax=Oryzias melastigma TaxID=30732 RepID=UPI000CF7DD97|nr:lipopolysaccharide-induced tumor necrosis factor-alpha factor homolog [Oryzias melastigma]